MINFIDKLYKMRLVHFDKYSNISKLNKLLLLHIGNTELKDGYVFLDNSKIICYTILKQSGKNIIIDWIYSKKGFGTIFLKRLEKILLSKYNKIVLKVSIDPNEKKRNCIEKNKFLYKK